MNVFLRALSSEGDAGSREDNATAQEARALSSEGDAGSREDNATAQDSGALSSEVGTGSREDNATTRDSGALSSEVDTGSREDNATGQKTIAFQRVHEPLEGSGMSPPAPRRRTHRRAAQGGYTLVELLVVITIIGLIVALVGPRVLGYLGDSKVKTAKIQIQGFASALDLFYLDAGRYPTSSEGLKALVQRPSGVATWNGPYLKGGSLPDDPWGKPYAYRAPGQNAPYEIVSRGSDGQQGGTGTAADISSASR